MAKAWLSTLLSELHREALKPAGFRKEGNRFSRDRGAYTERFQFQGSSGSTSQETTFYLNVGVEFSDRPSTYRDWIYLDHVHWATRIRGLIPESPESWRCRPETDRSALKLELAGLVGRASEKIERRIEKIRSEYLDRAAERGDHPV